MHERRRWFPTLSLEKRIDDREAAERAAVLHILAVKDVATGLDGRCDDQRLVERQLMSLCKRTSADVQIKCQCERRIEHG